MHLNRKPSLHIPTYGLYKLNKLKINIFADFHNKDNFSFEIITIRALINEHSGFSK